jgi:hypothetical protein
VTIAPYTIAGRAIESEIPLPELLSRPVRGADALQIRLGRVRPAARTVVAQEWLADGRLWRVVFGAEEGYLFHFPELAVFRTSRDAARVEVFPEPEIPHETLRHLLLDQVLPYLAPAWGADVFHASGVATPSGAIGFLGATGRGKSTLAAAFARRGDAVLSDDCFCLEESSGGFRARPWYPGLRLWPENPEAGLGRADGSLEVAHYTRKKRFRAPGLGVGDTPVRGIYLLEAPVSKGRIRIEKLSARNAAIELTRHAFFLDPGDFPGFRRFFDRVARLSESVPLFSLSYPRSFESLDQVVEEIRAHAEIESPALKS